MYATICSGRPGTTRKELETQEVTDIHDAVALADVAVGVVDEPLDVFVLKTSYGGEGSGTGGQNYNVDGHDSSALEHADSPMEEELGGFRFDAQDKVLKIRYYASDPRITAAMENEEMVSDDGA
ncbi:hypothetical protein E8E11_001151 [Didymella keratinophila]|nr:hypothetical protein E8E11_001151 [Didymella keratinophila]